MVGKPLHQVVGIIINRVLTRITTTGYRKISRIQARQGVVANQRKNIIAVVIKAIAIVAIIHSQEARRHLCTTIAVTPAVDTTAVIVVETAVDIMVDTVEAIVAVDRTGALAAAVVAEATQAAAVVVAIQVAAVADIVN